MPPKAKTVSAKKAPAAKASKAKTGRAATKSPAARGPAAAKKPRMSSGGKAALTGTLRETFYGVKNFDMVGEKSDVQIIGGYPWRLWLCRYGGGDHQLFIECAQNDETPVWHCDLEYTMTIHDAGYGQRFIQRKSDTVSMDRWLIRSEYLDRYMDKNFTEGEEWDEEGSEPSDYDSGAVDWVDVEVEITVKEAKGKRFRPKLAIDYYTADEKMFNATLAIGDKKIHVNKQFLSLHSSFFKDLFGSDKEKKEWKVDGVSPEDFAVLLNYLYRVDDKITVGTWETLAKLAHKFVMEAVKDGVEYFVMDYYEVAIWSEAKKLQVADQYGYETYKEMTMEGMKHTTEYGMEKVMKSEEYKGYSKEMKERLEKKMEEVKKKK